MAFRAGGRRAATCSPLNPPQEIPIIPTAPLHQGCAASQAINSTPLFLLGVLVEQQARRFAATSNVDADARVAVTCEIGMSQRVSFVSAVALAIREVLQDCRNWILLSI